MAASAKTQEDVNKDWDDMASTWDMAETRAYANGVYKLLFDADKIGITKEQVKGWRVLDFGCGTGLLADLLRHDVAEIVCLDAAPAMVKVVEGKVEKEAWANVTAVHCVVDGESAKTLALPPVDMVIASSSLTFVPDLVATLSAVREHLMKPGGLLIHTDWKADGSDYHDGFNIESATKVHLSSGLEIVKLHPSLSTGDDGENSIFAGVVRKPSS